MTKRTLLATAVLCVTAVTTLTACGDDKKAEDKGAGTAASATPSPAKPADPFKGLTAAQISEKARVAMTKLDSFKVKGGMTVDGKQMTFDFSVARKGDCQGTFTSRGASADVRQAGGQTYMKGDDKFWQQMGGEQGSSAEETNALTELLKGRWLKMPAGDGQADDQFPFCDIGAMFEKDKEETRLTRGADTEVNGTPAVTLTGKDGAETQTLLIAAEGEPYALRMSAKGGKEPGSFDFSAFNEPVTVTAPPAGEVMDPSKLKG
ncbi:hypothetical protein JK361_08140 [Streptomyces sp. 5-8]|uniref:Lipoprotein n=1 Tax=Streptomyces musisoli TaxID=2802280 RepID=A0ABS1NXB3_9ACTN|nr:hypothetical protein [Streptomyces musisoli]MBL1104565.1 hypothetical protein [Streptomyces musisoli]